MRLSGQKLADMRKYMMELYSAGHSISAIARLTGKDRSCVRLAINPDWAAIRRAQMRFWHELQRAE